MIPMSPHDVIWCRGGAGVRHHGRGQLPEGEGVGEGAAEDGGDRHLPCHRSQQSRPREVDSMFLSFSRIYNILGSLSARGRWTRRWRRGSRRAWVRGTSTPAPRGTRGLTSCSSASPPPSSRGTPSRRPPCPGLTYNSPFPYFPSLTCFAGKT